MNKVITILVVIAVVVVVFFMLGPLYVLDEGEQAVVIRFGEIVDVQRDAGLKFKTPVIDNVVRYPKRIQSWDGDPRRIPTEENQFIWVDMTARWQITDPELFYASLTTLEAGYSRLDDVIESSLRRVITNNRLHEAVRDTNLINRIDRSDAVEADVEELDAEGVEQIEELITTTSRQREVSRGRQELSVEMLESAAEVTPDFGVKLIDTVIRQIRYSDDLTESVYDRMVSERNRIAQAYRSFGEGRKEQILGELENERQQIISSAEREAQEIRGDADAQAARVYSEAYQQDPDFFEFYRAISSYEETLPRFRKTLTTDMDYFDFLYSEDGQ